MKREDFVTVAEETLDSLPEEFRSRIQNVVIFVEDFRLISHYPNVDRTGVYFWASFTARPLPRRVFFDLSAGPAHIVLYQKNIETFCSNEAEVRHQIRQRTCRKSGKVYRTPVNVFGAPNGFKGYGCVTVLYPFGDTSITYSGAVAGRSIFD